MKIHSAWMNKMRFTGQVDGHAIEMDAHSPIGEDSAPTPKELVIMGIAGCTGMDVVALMKKYKEPLESLELEVDVTPTEKVQPAVFKDVMINYAFKGQLNKEKVLEAVRLSQTKYCGVSAMIAKTAPISYKVFLNSALIGSGEAAFGQE